MQYEQGNEKKVITDGRVYPVIQLMPVHDELQTKRTRKTLLVLTGICLALGLMTASVIIAGLAIRSNVVQRTELILPLFAILFYGFGFHVAKKTHRIGLRVFAWLGIINLIFIGILVILLSIVLINSASMGMDRLRADSILCVLTVFLIVAFIVTVTIVGLSFKLARLIPTSKI